MSAEQQKRVLVVDDDPDVREVLGAALRQRPLIVDHARDGEEALALLHEREYAVVILDLFMPRVDGMAVLEQLDRVAASAPVVLVLTAADQHVTQRLDPRRIHGIVRKPFDPIEIAGIVAACAEIKTRSAFEKMALAAFVAGSPFMAWFSSRW
jgi:DNA-binding response OmpR family regulator